MYTCVPPSLSERTLGKDSNRPRARQPEHQREREPTPGRLEGGRKETNLQRRRDWGEGACHCSSGTAVSAASQTKAQKAFSFSLSLSPFSFPTFSPLVSFLFLLLKQNSFLFSSFHSKKSSSFFPVFFQYYLSPFSFHLFLLCFQNSQISSLFSSHGYSPASSLLSDTQNFTISPVWQDNLLLSLLTPPTSSKENQDSLFSILSFTFPCIVLLRQTVYS